MQATIRSIPEDYAEFETLAAARKRPEDVCALALLDKDKDAGTAAMNILRGPRPLSPYDAQFLRDRLRGSPICRSPISRGRRRKTATPRARRTR